MNATVIQTSDGQVRLFEDHEQALAWEALQEPNVCIVAEAEVNKEKHYRGPIGPDGVRFTKEDQSTSQLIGAMWNK